MMRRSMGHKGYVSNNNEVLYLSVVCIFSNMLMRQEGMLFVYIYSGETHFKEIKRGREGGGTD